MFFFLFLGLQHELVSIEEHVLLGIMPANTLCSGRGDLKQLWVALLQQTLLKSALPCGNMHRRTWVAKTFRVGLS